MRIQSALALVPLALVAAPGKPAKAPAAKPAASPFPFKIHQKTLPNGLKVAVVPTGMPNLVSLQIPVSTGSRNEVEPGKSGFAHFFEHMMFRGTPTVSPEQWGLALQESGASQNAYTSSDLTNYHTLFGKEDLEKWIRLEADRFQHLSYSEAAFKTESRAVLGEYNKNSANPLSKLIEVMSDAAYTTHPYKHTTMGFLKDIEDMPNQYAYSKQFFQRWYKPENVTVVVTGDVEPEKTFALVEKYFGAWKRGTAKPPVIPQEPEPKAPVSVHVPWASPTLPWVSVGFHAPTRFSTTRKDALALGLVGELMFGSQSELYQRLVVKEQKLNALFAGGGDQKDPSLFTVYAQVKRPQDLAYVRGEILEAYAKALALPFSEAKVEEAKQEARLDLARRMDSTANVAAAIARMSSYDRDPEALPKLAALRDTVVAEDLARVAKATFQDARRVITTLSHEALPEDMKKEPEGVEARSAKLAKLPSLRLLERPSESPVVNVRVSFRVGSIHDPKGREGMARFAASLVLGGATRSRTTAELTKAYAATGASVTAVVDKERTSFVLNAPRAKASEALDLFLEQLTEAAVKADDVNRLRASQVNALKVGLKANNDEELGKVALEARMYTGPYGTPILGTESGLNNTSATDLKDFIDTYYTPQRLMAGIGGGFSPELKAQLLRGLGRLKPADSPKVLVTEAEHLTSSHLQIITKDTRATAISFGLPLRERNEKGEPIDNRVNRTHPDFPALWIATSHLGQHRNSTGVLYKRLREVRGLNYGNYAYLEPFPNGMFQFQPDPGVARYYHHWQVWIRPVPSESAAFALKAALFELGKLVQAGLSEEEFRASQTFLVKFLDHLTDTGAKRLGHDMDNAFYGLGDYADTMKERLKKVTREDVNRVVKKYLRTDSLDIVAITKDAEAFKRDLLSDATPLPAYSTPKPELKDEDERIRKIKLDLDPKDIVVTPLEEVFK